MKHHLWEHSYLLLLAFFILIVTRLFHLLKVALFNKDIDTSLKKQFLKWARLLLIGPLLAIVFYFFLYTRYRHFAKDGLMLIGICYGIGLLIALFQPIKNYAWWENFFDV